MTLPVVTVCATCGDGCGDCCVGAFTVCLQPGFRYDLTFRLQDRDGVVTDWPVGMIARLRAMPGTGAAAEFPGTVDDAYLRFALTAAQTTTIRRGSTIWVDLNYTGLPGDWRPWRRGRV